MSIQKFRQQFVAGAWVLFAAIFYAGGYFIFGKLATTCARDVQGQDFVSALGSCQKAQAFGFLYQWNSAEKYHGVVNELAMAELQNQQYDKARKHLQENLAYYERSAPQGSRDYAITLIHLGLAGVEDGNFAQQQDWFRRATKMLDELELSCDPTAVQAAANLGGSLLASGQSGEAEAALRRRVDANRRCKDVPPSARGATLRILADAQTANGKLAEAAKTLDQAVELIEQGRGGASVEMAYALISRARALAGIQRYAESRHDGLRAIQMLEQYSGRQSPEIGTAFIVLATVSMQKGDFARALDEYSEAEKIYTSQLGTDHLWLAELYSQKARALQALGRDAEANSARQNAARIGARAGGS